MELISRVQILIEESFHFRQHSLTVACGRLHKGHEKRWPCGDENLFKRHLKA